MRGKVILVIVLSCEWDWDRLSAEVRRGVCQTVDTETIETLVTRPPGAARAMMQALEDDMDARPGLYRRLAAGA